MQTTPQERAASLRQQLAEVQAKQTELETRLQQLEADLKPENIEKVWRESGVCARKKCASSGGAS